MRRALKIVTAAFGISSMLLMANVFVSEILYGRGVYYYEPNPWWQWLEFAMTVIGALLFLKLGVEEGAEN